jgi:hypothetical protein
LCALDELEILDALDPASVLDTLANLCRRLPRRFRHNSATSCLNRRSSRPFSGASELSVRLGRRGSGNVGRGSPKRQQHTQTPRRCATKPTNSPTIKTIHGASPDGPELVVLLRRTAGSEVVNHAQLRRAAYCSVIWLGVMICLGRMGNIVSA